MPRKAVIDREPVRAALEETGWVVNAAAQRLGLHVATVTVIKRELCGECRRCGKTPLVEGLTLCAACAEYIRAFTRAKNRKKGAAGICQQCNEPVDPPSTQFCAKHRAVRNRDAKRNRKRYARDMGDAWSQRVSRWNRKQVFGDAGNRVWDKTKGGCAVCGATYRKRRTDIHHIDKDRSNNTDENLICLCKECHRLVHAIEHHPNLTLFLPWFRTTYPSIPI